MPLVRGFGLQHLGKTTNRENSHGSIFNHAGRSAHANAPPNIFQHTDQLIINNSDNGPLLKVCAANPAEILHEPQLKLEPSPASQGAHNTGCYSNQSWVCVTEGY